MLDMNVLKNEIHEYPAKLLTIAEEINGDPKFTSQPVYPSDLIDMLRISD
jgi:hypothetical protein